MTENLPVARNTVVGLKYIMFNRHNEVLEDWMVGDPVCYVQGGSVIMSGLQEKLEGLVAGDRKTFFFHPGDDECYQGLRFDVIIFSVRAATPAELVLGYPLPLTADCGPGCDCYFTPGAKEISVYPNSGVQ